MPKTRINLTIFVLLIVFFSFGVWGFVFEGQQCSTTAAEYQLYDATGVTNENAQTYEQDISADLASSGTSYTIFIENLIFDNVNDGDPKVRFRTDGDGDLLIFYGDYLDGGFWSFNTVSTNISDSGNTYLNVSVHFDRFTDQYNGTIAITNDYDNISSGSLNNDFDFGKVEFGDLPSQMNYSGMYVWNGTSCPESSQESSASLNLSSPNPLNDTQFNTVSLNFNLTVNSSSVFNCSLYLNDTLNQTTTDHAVGTDTYVDFNVTFSDSEEQTYSYIIGCTNNNNDTNTSQERVFYVDNVDPTITTEFENVSVYYQNLLTGQFNFSDGFMLYSYNVSVDGTQIDYQNQLNTTAYVYNLSYNISGLFVGEHNLSVKIADGHTAAELGGSYGVSDGWFEDYLRYDFWDYGYARIDTVDGSIFDEFTTTKEKDKYTFTYAPSDTTKKTYEFDITSSEPIFIVEKEGSKYGQWLIMGDHWLDFVMEKETKEQITMNKIDPYTVRVSITGLSNTNLLEFTSIGDLNIVEENFTFVTSNSTLDFDSEVIELQTQTITLDLNKSTGITTDATLFWNNTIQTVTKTNSTYFDTFTSSFVTPNVGGQENISFYWNYSLTGAGADEFGNISGNQTVFATNIDNCSTFTTVSVNMTVKNETSNLAITDDLSPIIDGFFTVFGDTDQNFTEFNLSWAENSTGNYGICIDPDSANYTINAQMEYDATGFQKKLYYFNNFNLNNETVNIDLFLTDGTTAVTLTVKDFDDSVVQGAVIKVLSYDLTTDSFTTTEIAETDSNGEAIVQLVLNDDWYAFIVEVDGEVKLQTLPAKITTTTKTLRVDLSDVKYFDRYGVTRGITHSLTWTNSSKTFTFTWTDPSGSIVYACLKVERDTFGNNAVLTDRCEQSTAGSLLYTIVDNITDQSYTATSYVKFSENELYILDTLTQKFSNTFKTFGLSGIFATFLIVVTLVGIGIWSPVVAVLLAIFALLLAHMLQIFILNWVALSSLLILGGILLYKLSKS